MKGWNAPEPENFEGNEGYESQHFGLEGMRDMGHGPTCNHCNDAIINDYENEIPGRSNKSFNYGAAKHNSKWILPKDSGGEMKYKKRDLE